MTWSTSALRAAFAWSWTTTPDGNRCPTPELLHSAAHFEVPAAELEPLVDHLATCGVCAEAWRIAARTPSFAPSRQRRP